MLRKELAIVLLALGLFVPGWAMGAEDFQVPEKFKRFDAVSKTEIPYTDLDSLLDAVVLNVGRSTRERADPSQSKTGTRMKVKVNRATINEGNRFFYEIFDDNEQNQATLRQIRDRLVALPAIRPLETFNRDEQLAYWLNLYNVTLLNEIVQVYPQRDLERFLMGRKSILDQKLLTVSGVPLSLNDIQFGILYENYESNPLVMYGLYQGVIGGPSIRKSAYTGKYVWGDLIDNALEFINSNRGTEMENEEEFRASSLYERNQVFFPIFESDLRKHLLRYLEGDEKDALQLAGRIETDIEDWTVTDLYGSYRDLGGSIASSNAALVGSVAAPSGVGFTPSMGYSPGGRAITRYPPDVYKHLDTLNRQSAESDEATGTVTIEELEVAEEQAAEKDRG